jgi:hypothetical protein
MNRRMFEKVKRGDAIDVSDNPRTAEGYYKLGDFLPGIDYCDLRAQAWVWSIGKHKITGKILASTGSDFYQNPAYECLFLR